MNSRHHRMESPRATYANAGLNDSIILNSTLVADTNLDTNLDTRGNFGTLRESGERGSFEAKREIIELARIASASDQSLRVVTATYLASADQRHSKAWMHKETRDTCVYIYTHIFVIYIYIYNIYT